MARARRRLNATAVAVSVAAHLLVLLVLAPHAPRLMRPYEDPGPPEPVIPVLIMPRTPPPPPGATEPPRPIRLHRRQLRRGVEAPDIEPFVAPPSLPTPRPAPARPNGPPRFAVRPSPSEQVATTLRGGLVGCANPDLLTAAERERCLERLGGGARGAASLGPLNDAVLAGAANARETRRRALEAPAPIGPTDALGSSSSSYRNAPLYDPTPPRLRP